LLFDRAIDRLAGKLVTAATRKTDPQGEADQANHVADLAFSADGKTLVARTWDKAIRIWDVASRKERRRIDVASDWGGGHVALSPDARIVAGTTSHDGTIVLWDAVSGKELRRLQAAQGMGHHLAFAADGKTLASAGGDGIRLWDVQTGRELRPFKGPSRSARFVAFSPDGRTLASGGGDQTVCLWELASRQERCRFAGHRGTINAGAFSADGKRLATASEDTTVLVWDITGVHPPSSGLALEELWKGLAAEDARQAYRALCALAGTPQPSMAFLQKKLRPVGVLDARQRKQIQQWIADLDGDGFRLRSEATQQLERLGELAVPELRLALKATQTLEAQKRVQRVLDKLQGPERLRLARAVEALEHAGTPEARHLLGQFAGGAPEAFLTMEANAALERLRRSPLHGD
jgi:hypothetical protein